LEPGGLSTPRPDMATQQHMDYFRTPPSAPPSHAKSHRTRRPSPPESIDTSDMDEPAEVPPEHHALFEDPSHLVCPLSSELFREPVIGRSGRKYEREAIVRWLRQGNNGDPITRMPMTEADLTTSYDDKAAAETYRRTTASKCVALSCEPSCPAPVAYLRRAARLVFATDIAVRGLSPEMQSYLISHGSSEYDAIALRMFARCLADQRHYRDAAAVHFRMMVGVASGQDPCGPLPASWSHGQDLRPGSLALPSSPSQADRQRREEALESLRLCFGCFAPGGELGNASTSAHVTAMVDGFMDLAGRLRSPPWPELADMALEAMGDSRVGVCLLERLLGEARPTLPQVPSMRRLRASSQGNLETVLEGPSHAASAVSAASRVPLEQRVQLVAKYAMLMRSEVSQALDAVRDSQAAMIEEVEALGAASRHNRWGGDEGVSPRGLPASRDWGSGAPETRAHRPRERGKDRPWHVRLVRAIAEAVR